MKNLTILISILIITSSCGIYKYSDARKNPVNAKERVEKNIKEGRGFKLGSIGGNKGGDFLFSSSNPLWRATMDKLSFAPLSVVDYGGGIIITDWISQNSDQEEIKITIRFLTNEIRSDSINVIIHKRKCDANNKCKTNEIKNTTNNEIKFAILKKAAELDALDLAKIKEENKDLKIPGKDF